MEFQAVVMAGGRGSHMLDLTGSIPKPLIPVGNKPLIWYTIKMLESAGFTEAIVVTLNSIKNDIEIVMREFKMEIKIVGIPEDSEMDTVDALLLIKDRIKTDILVVSCDLVTDLPFHRIADVHRLNDATITMLLCPSKADFDNLPGVKPKKKGQQRQREFIGISSNDRQNHRVLFLANEADLENEVLPVRQSLLQRFPRFQVRTDLHDAHMYIVKKWLINYLSHNKLRSSFRSEVLPYVVQKQFAKSCEKATLNELDVTQKSDTKDIFFFCEYDNEKDYVTDLSLTLNKKDSISNKISCFAYVYDEGVCMNVNNLSLFMEANRHVSKPESAFLSSSNRIPATTKIDERSQVGTDCLMGDRTEVGERSAIKRSMVGKSCVIGSNVKIANCVIMDRVRVANGCNISGSVLCQDVNVGEACELKDCFVGSQRKLPPQSQYSRETLVDSEVMMEFE